MIKVAKAAHAISEFSSKAILRASCAGLCASLAVQPALAQDAGEEAEADDGLQVVVVTAQKREQSAQDVPLSLSLTDGKFIANTGLQDVQAVATYVPNLTITTSPGISQINVRGIGSSAATRSFEQSVGVYVDEIYSPRSVSVGLPLLDVDRVEVLRGPQGVLFGKNSIAGAISISTAKPDRDFGGEVSGRYELEYGSYQLQGHVSVPVADNLYVRVAGIYQDSRGYIAPVVTGGDKEPSTELSGVRGTILWEPTSETTVTLKYEHYDINTDGDSMQLVGLDPDTPRSGLANYIIAQNQAGGEDFVLDNRHYSDFVNSIRQNNDNVTLRIDQEIGDFGLTYLAGYSNHDRVQRNAFDFSAIDMIIQQLDEKYEQMSHEIRLSSPTGGLFEYTVGAYYIDRDLTFPDSKVRVKFPPNSPLSFTFARPYTEEAEAWSVFAQGTVNLTDTFNLTLGGRYNSEIKQASMTGTLYEPIDDLDDTSAPITSQIVLGGIAATPLAFANFSASGRRVERNFDPSVNVKWEPVDDVNLYASWSRATKSGGFNNNDANGTNFEFEPEEVEAIEVGIKSRFLDNRAQLNVSLFHNDYTDLQVSYFDGNGFQTGNAAEALVKGVEAELLFEVARDFQIGGDIAYLDAKYESYLGACSTNSSIWTGDCLDNGGQFQDLAGVQIENAPEWSAHLFADFRTGLTSDLDFATRADASYKSSYSLTADQDPNNFADSIWLVDLRVAVEDADSRWSVAVVGRNLFNNQITTFGGSAPLIPGAYFGNITVPRQVDLNFRYSF